MSSIEFLKECEKDLNTMYETLDDIAFFNEKKVLKAFQNNKVSLRNFYGSTGYAYDDSGKETLGKIYAEAFGCQKAIVSPLITGGTHALFLGLSAILRPNDVMLSITGEPYDTLIEAINGKDEEDIGSLKDFNIKYEQIDLKDGHVNIELAINKILELNPKIIYMQRSRGYGLRSAISVDEFQDVISKIKQINSSSYIFVDNCYGEFVETREPVEVGADIMVGSLCKNPGGGICATGAYVAGTKKAVDLVEKRLTAPSIGLEVGGYELGYRQFYQGFFVAPQTVKNILKGTYLIGRVMEKLGYNVFPSSEEQSYDIVKSIIFDNSEQLIKFVQLVQKVSPVDSDALPLPWDMPGYDDQVIMAAGTFVQGASIELSCDSPIRSPYVAYFQGGLTYEHIKILAEKVYELYKK